MFLSDNEKSSPEIVFARFCPEAQVGEWTDSLIEDIPYILIIEVKDPDKDIERCIMSETGPEDFSYYDDAVLPAQTEIVFQYYWGPVSMSPPYGLYSISLTVIDEDGNESNEVLVDYYVVSE